MDHTDDLGPAGESRRAALRAGVGVGIGIAAWSGPAITSLGASPAYAAVCTVPAVESAELAGDRNVDGTDLCSAGEPLNPGTFDAFRWHASVPTLKPLYTIDILSNFEDKCSNLNRQIHFSHPIDVKCQIQAEVYDNSSKAVIWNDTFSTTGYTATEGFGTATFPTFFLDKGGPTPKPPEANYLAETDARYSIAFVCVPLDAQCYPPGW